jgi:hypothetical protein
VGEREIKDAIARRNHRPMFSKIEKKAAPRGRKSAREWKGSGKREREMTRAIKILALLFLVAPFVMQMRPATERSQRRDIFSHEAALFLCEHHRK